MPVSEWTAADVVECVIRGHWSNAHPIINVLHIRNAIDAPAAVALDVMNNWQDHIVAIFVDNYTLDDLRYTEKTTLTGETGVIAPDPAKFTVGQTTGTTAATPNVATIIRKNIVSTVGHRRGRLYLPPLGESSLNEDGQLLNTSITTLNSAFADFKSGIDDVDQDPVVVHKREASIGASPVSVITSFTADPTAGTQRRRLR